MAYLDDHVFLLEGLLELLQAAWRPQDLRLAMELAELLLTHYEDSEQGGFYFTADDHEQLIHRPKPSMDDALPSGNGVAALVLGRLGHLLGEPRYTRAAERTLQNAWQMLSQMPYVHCALLDALEEYLYPPEIIILRGEGEEFMQASQLCQQGYSPRRLSLAIPATENDLPGLLAERASRNGFIAYPCSGTTCQSPITDVSELATTLQANQLFSQGT